MNANKLAYTTGTFDHSISGFMGWYDCFDFSTNQFTQADLKSKEILRILKDGGSFACCSWEEQQDLKFMEQSILHYYPAILDDREYLERRPIGLAYEKPEGYEIILRCAGFRNIQIIREEAIFISTNEEEWWQQMLQVGWASLVEKIEQTGNDQIKRIKNAIFNDLHQYKGADGIQFSKNVFFVSGMK